MKCPVTKLKNGRRATVVELQGGSGMASRLAAMGIRVGVKFTKVSGIALKGPVVLRVGGSNVAVGHGIAQRIVAEFAEGETR